MSTDALSRGDVVLTQFPFTDLTRSTLRPAAIVSAGKIGMDVVLIGISSVVRGGGIATDFKVEKTHPEFRSTGLRTTSVLRTHKLATVDRSIIVRRLGALGPKTTAAVEKRLREVLELPEL